MLINFVWQQIFLVYRMIWFPETWVLLLKLNVCPPRAQCSHLSSSRQSPCFPWRFSLARLHPWYIHLINLSPLSSYEIEIDFKTISKPNPYLSEREGVNFFFFFTHTICTEAFCNRSVSLVLGMRLWLQQLKETW